FLQRLPQSVGQYAHCAERLDKKLSVENQARRQPLWAVKAVIKLALLSQYGPKRHKKSTCHKR
ncbi:hypothetical protein, partial [Pseudomonas amygdali]|uniref:hypothetical protein n=1 Tax=Pseudomonas amygdali TaxID=47877 RepID=UPI001F204867